MAKNSNETLTAIFKCESLGTDITLCVAIYCTLVGGITRGSAILKLAEIARSRFNCTNVQFQFWCSGVTQNGGAPIRITH